MDTDEGARAAPDGPNIRESESESVAHRSPLVRTLTSSATFVKRAVVQTTLASKLVEGVDRQLHQIDENQTPTDDYTMQISLSHHKHRPWNHLLRYGVQQCLS